MSENKSLVEALTDSKVYKSYERAFCEATGLPVSLRPVETWQLPHHGKKNENRFCALMSQKSRSCAACLQVQQKLSETATHEAKSVTCSAGLCDSAVPIRTGSRLIGFLQTGQVFRKKPTAAQFDRTLKLTTQWGVEVDAKELREAYFETRVLPAKHHEAVINLLSIFAEHLAIVTNQAVMQQESAEPLAITRAKDYIKAHQTEDLSLGQVAKAVNTSSFYFCKLFKKATGINFTDYVSRSRIESAKNLLLNRNLRISEVAYEVGFQSLTHFNRVFKKLIGESPTTYRSHLGCI
jgi:AraC-like DNA-binding protein